MTLAVSRLVPVGLILGALALVTGCGSSHTARAAADATDRAFVRQMIPHHEMAVSMSRSAGSDAIHPQIKSLAVSITQAQDAEIAQMRPIARSLGVTPAPTPAGPSMAADASMNQDDRTLGLTTQSSGMSMDMSTLPHAHPYDRAFIDMMIPHHQGAIRMARAELAHGTDPQLRHIATAIIAGQSTEIREMNRWRTEWYGAPSPAGGIPRG